MRLRLGATLHGGATLGGSVDDPEGWMAGVSLRLGTQIGDWLALYYQPSGFVTGLQSAARDDAGEAVAMWHSVLLETTLFDVVSLGGGPSMDFYFGCDAAIQGQSGCAAQGAFFGLHGRAAVDIGGAALGQRGAVSLSLDVHPTWFRDDAETVAFLGGVGVELF